MHGTSFEKGGDARKIIYTVLLLYMIAILEISGGLHTSLY